MELASDEAFPHRLASEPVTDAHPESLRRALSVHDLIIYGMVYMLPIAPFALFGIIDNVAHGYVALAYLASAVALSFTAHSYMVMSKEFPAAGSVYTYTQKGLGHVAGFFAGWLVFLDYIISPAILAVVSAAAMNGLIPAVPRSIWVIGFIAIGTGLNLVGVNITARANKVMLFVMLGILAIYVGAGLWSLYGLGRGNGGLTLHALYNPATFRIGSISTAVLLASSNVLGFDAITTLGEEVRQEHKHLLGLAGIITLFGTIALFVLQCWIATDLAPGSTIRSPDTAFYDIALHAGGPWLYALTTISTALAFGVPCAIVSQMAISRIIFAMGRDRQLPHVFARLGRNQQPYVAILFVTTVALVVSLWFQNHLDQLVLFQNFGAFTAFALVNISLIGYFWVKQRSRNLLRHLIMPLIGLVIVVTLLLAMKAATLKMGAIWLTCGVFYYVFLRKVLKRTVILDV